MKKLFMMACMMLMSTAMFAQIEEGQVTIKPAVGINIAGTGFDGTKSKIGIIAGAEAEYDLLENFGISAGVFYSQEGCKEDDLKMNLDYINVPILANYYVIPGLAIKAGVQPGILVSAKGKEDGESVDMKDSFKSFNLSIPVGLSYQYQNIVLDARYNIGVTKLLKDVDSGNKSGHSFTITIGYKFAL